VETLVVEAILAQVELQILDREIVYVVHLKLLKITNFFSFSKNQDMFYFNAQISNIMLGLDAYMREIN
jgi:hypothetical protein